MRMLVNRSRFSWSEADILSSYQSRFLFHTEEEGENAMLDQLIDIPDTAVVTISSQYVEKRRSTKSDLSCICEDNEKSE